MRPKARINAIPTLVILIMATALLCASRSTVAAEQAPPRPMRNVSFELDVVDGALSYEVEITRPTGKLVGRFPLKTPVFSGKLIPGSYRLRSRSTDSRGLAGEWSDSENFEVHALAPTLLQPTDQSVAKPDTDGRVRFKWQAGSGAVRYRIEIKSSVRTISEFTESTDFATWLPAGDYEVKIASLLPDGAGGEKSEARSSFKLEKDLPKDRFGQIDFVWKPVPGASNYEIEIRSDEVSEVRRIAANEWHAPYRAGRYRVRTRARKADESFSKWSSSTDLEILSFGPYVRSPALDARVETKDKIETRVDFEWMRSAGAARYRLEVHAVDPQGQRVGGKPIVSEDLLNTSYAAKLEVGQGYSWKLTPMNDRGEVIEGADVSSRLLILGSELSPPKIKEPGTRYVNALQWLATDVSNKFDYSLQRWDAGKKGWAKVVQKRKSAETMLPFRNDYPGGSYRLAVRSVADFRKPSEFTILEFPVYDGDRSPEATEALRRREFLSPIPGLYLHASYLVANMAYTGEDAESNSSIAFSALGGTGRLGLGYNPPGRSFGLFGVVDLSGFQISQKNYTFASSEAHFQYRDDRGNFQYRYSVGLFYKELVEVRGALGRLDFSDVASVATAGPHFGVEAVYALNHEYGLHTGIRIYRSMMGIKTPNGAATLPTMSYQLSLLGSKKLGSGAVGYLGYTYRLDNAAYKSTPNNDASGAVTSLAGPDSRQEIAVSGHYLNLVYEFAW